MKCKHVFSQCISLMSCWLCGAVYHHGARLRGPLPGGAGWCSAQPLRGRQPHGLHTVPEQGLQPLPHTQVGPFSTRTKTTAPPPHSGWSPHGITSYFVYYFHTFCILSFRMKQMVEFEKQIIMI